MNEFDEKEFLALCESFHAEPFIKDVDIWYENPSYFYKMKSSIQQDRRGEVVFCVRRPAGTYIAVTCEEYPKGIFRIPTGGIGYGEDVVEAVYREVREELGVDTVIEKFAGVIKNRFRYNQEEEMFYSYLFILRETGGHLLTDATDNEVSEVREVDLTGLDVLVERLGSIEGSWHDWGLFRRVSSGAILAALRSSQSRNGETGGR